MKDWQVMFILFILSLFLFCWIGYNMSQAFAQTSVETQTERQSLFLKAYTPPVMIIKEKVLGSLITRVIECESGWNNSAIGAAGEIGLCQFLPETWKYFNELRGTNLDIYNKEHQLDLIDWAFKNNLEDHWTCYHIITK